MRIQTNVNAMNALRNLGVTEGQQSRAIERLSSGFRLNRSGDDAAGMSIANSLRNNGRALQQAQRNASQAGSLLQIADGAVQTLSTILDRMKELATESASDSVTDADRAKIDAEFTSLKQEIDRIVGSTVYQGTKLLDGTFGVRDSGTGTLNSTTGVTGVTVTGAAASTTFTITQSAATAVTMSNGTGAGTVSQTVATSAGGAGISQKINFDKLGVSFTYTGTLGATTLNGLTVITGSSTGGSFRVGAGAVADSDNLVAVTLGNLTTTGLGVSSSGVATSSAATSALTAIDSAVSSLNTSIGTIGAAQNRLDYATANVNSLYQNVAAAESAIRDADMAAEYTQYSKLQILQQAGTAMLAQANTSGQSVLTLLRG